ncbi:MAG TPA: GntR family transcriptional regulator [Kineosporiaceae bacterium]|nr:GntR family transcriptional regulator [Kineosporiaceae bacterium]
MVSRAVPVPRSALAEVVTIDRNSPIPLYYQVAQALQRAIEEGKLPPGSRLDNELQLADDLGLSRPTMRKAMEYLVDQGLLVRRRGIGTTVIQPKVRRPMQLSSLFDDLQTAGKRPATAVLTFDVVPASAEVAQALKLDEGTPVNRLVRLRSADGRPIAVMTNYLPTDLPGLGPDELTAQALEESGLYKLLRSAGIHLHAADQVVGARKATTGEAELLDEPRGAALLTMQRVSYDDFGRVVEFGTHVYAGSRYSFSLSLLDS